MIRRDRPAEPPQRPAAPDDDALRDALDEGLSEDEAAEEAETRAADESDEVAREEVRQAREEGLSEEDTPEELEARAGGLPGTDQQVVPPPGDPREGSPA